MVVKAKLKKKRYITKTVTLIPYQEAVHFRWEKAVLYPESEV